MQTPPVGAEVDMDDLPTGHPRKWQILAETVPTSKRSEAPMR